MDEDDVAGWVVAADRRRALEEEEDVVSATTGTGAGADTSRPRFFEPSVVPMTMTKKRREGGRTEKYLAFRFY